MTRPLLSLVMMVRDESASIREVLESVKSHIDQWTIIDTGSTDNTPDIVREVLAGIPGQLLFEPFVDYKTTRNRVLELDAYTSEEAEPNTHVLTPREGRAVFGLFLSGDEFLHEGDKLREHLEKNRDTDFDCHALLLTVEGVSKSPSLRVFRTGSPWHYEDADCGVHEFPSHPDPAAKVAAVQGAFIEHKAADPEARRANIWDRHIPLLEAALERNPKNSRALVYLAQSYESLFVDMDDAQRVQYAMGTLALYMRRLTLPFDTDAERAYVRRMFLDTARVAGIFLPDEMLARTRAQHLSEPERPESALFYAIAAMGALHATATDAEVAAAYELAVRTVQIAVEFKADDTGPVSSQTAWQAHLLAARIAFHLAMKGEEERREEWKDRVKEHAAAGVEAGGSATLFLPIVSALDGEMANIPLSSLQQGE